MFSTRNSDLKMVIADLDGTLLNNDRKIGLKDYSTLIKLGVSGILRVIATGRSLYSCLKVLVSDCPFDYLVFSSGAGIMDWKTKKIIFTSSIEKRGILEIEAALRKLNLNFSIQFPIPENHHYYFYKGNYNNTDFDYRNELYSAFNAELNGSYPLDSASQFLIILNDEGLIQNIKELFPAYKIIRATSPIDNQSIWIEIFNLEVSKAKGGKYICQLKGIPEINTLGIGNDYNDLDLLDWVSHSFIVANAPEPIKRMYNQCADNQNNPLTDSLNLLSFDFDKIN